MPTPDRQHYDTAWTLRVLLAVAVFVVSIIAAGPLSVYLVDGRVMPVIIVLATISLIASMANIGIVTSVRTMQFNKEFSIQVRGQRAGFFVGTGTAVLTRSYWALVAGIAAMRAVTVLMSYAMHPFRPRLSLSRKDELLSFSVRMLAANLLDSGRIRVADLWTARLFGTRSVGLFSMAREITDLATTEFAAPLNRVAFSKYSLAQGDGKGLGAMYSQISGIIWSVGLPAAAGIFVCAREIILLLLGPQWVDGASVLRILAVGGACAILNANTSYVFWAIGRGTFVCFQSLLNLVVFALLALKLANTYGVNGMAWAQALATLPTLIISYVALHRWLGLSLMDIFYRNWRVIVASVGMGYMVWILETRVVDTVHWLPLWKVALLVGSGGITYVAALASLWLATGSREGPERYFASLLRKLPMFAAR